MNKKTYLIPALCFFLGVLLAGAPALIYISKIADEEDFAKANLFGSSSLTATYAYQFGPNFEAIDKIQRFLFIMDWEEKHGGNPGVNFPINKALAYGQLAQLYHNMRQTNMSETCIAEALENAKESGLISWVTNETALAVWVGRYPPRMVKP